MLIAPSDAGRGCAAGESSRPNNLKVSCRTARAVHVWLAACNVCRFPVAAVAQCFYWPAARLTLPMHALPEQRCPEPGCHWAHGVKWLAVFFIKEIKFVNECRQLVGHVFFDGFFDLEIRTILC